MKKAIILTVTAVLIVIAAGWLFFSYGGTTRQPQIKSTQSVLEVQDTRLTKGETSAPVKIVEYADILCPYCAKANSEVIPQIQNNYIDKQQAHYEVRLVAMIAPDSLRAAEGAYCAAEQNKFWKYLDTAYSDTFATYNNNLSPQDVTLFSEDSIYGFASKLGLDMPSWQECMASGTYKETISQNKQKMSELKAYGTPHFIINGSNYNGSPPFPAFKAVIDAELNRLQAES